MSDSAHELKETENIVFHLFKTMDDSPASSSDCLLTKQWLESHDNYFTGFMNGCWMPKSSTSDNKEVRVTFAEDYLATVKIASFSDVEASATNALEAFNTWQQYLPNDKAKVLYRIADIIEQQSMLINGVGNLTNSKKNQLNISYLVDSFNYCAGLIGDENIFKGWHSTGVVCLICEDVCSSMTISAAWQIPALLAAGNSILFLVADSINLSAFLLAELFTSAGLPPGMFNVLFSDKKSFSSLAKVHKIILPSLKQQDMLYVNCSNLCIPFDCLLHKSVTVIIYENADLDAAVSNLLEILNINYQQKTWPTCKMYLQESIKKTFIELLTNKVFGAISGNKMKPSFYFMSNKVVSAQLHGILSTNANTERGDYSFSICKSIITDVDRKTPAVVIAVDSKIKESQIHRDGPGVNIEIFRTVKESINMFNLDKMAPSVSVWTEEMCLAFDVAHKLKSRTVWINSQNLFEPDIAHGSMYLSGNSVVGGKEGVYRHLSIYEKRNDCKTVDFNEIQSYGLEAPPSNVILVASPEDQKIKKHFKLFIGGSFLNSADNSVQITADNKDVPYAVVSSANKSDVDKAVSSARAAMSKWETCLKSKRSLIMRKVCDALNKRKYEFISELCSITGSSKEICAEEVETTANILFFWANYITHFSNHVVETKQSGGVIQQSYPLGVIGIQCPDKEPLLSFVFLITPAIVMGNTVVAIASEKYPTCALKLCEVFQSAGLPSGVLNVIAGQRSYLTRHLTSHLSIDAIWFSVNGEAFIHNSYHTLQPKRIFNCINISNVLDEAKKLKFILESMYSKAVYIPMGTGFS